MAARRRLSGKPDAANSSFKTAPGEREKPALSAKAGLDGRVFFETVEAVRFRAYWCLLLLSI
jgi:hypothetical protein